MAATDTTVETIPAAETKLVEETSVEQQPEQKSQAKKMQMTITVAIVAAVVLFFAGLGLGFLIGKHAPSDDIRSRFNTSLRRGGNFNLQRLQQRSTINGGSSSSSLNSSTNTQEN